MTTRQSATALRHSVRGVALFEAGKGVVALLSAIGAVSLLHHDVAAVIEQWAAHLHLNAAKRVPAVFMHAIAQLTDARLWLLAVLAACYSGLRFIEAYGLWHHRRWAEWLAAASGAIYIPFEIYELLRHVSWLSATAFIVNVAIVGLMISALRARKAANGQEAGH